MTISLYQKHILPKYLNLMMKDESFKKDRQDVTKEAQGTGLEIGFGSGLNLPYYKNISKLYAIDPSQELFDLAKENLKNISFPVEYIQASAENIPIPDHSLDFVVSTWTLCSIPYPEIALKEVSRVLKPGGKFSFIEHGKSPKSFIAILQNIFTPFSKRIAGGCHMNRDIEKLILNAGFKIEKIEKSSQRSKPLGFMYKGWAHPRLP